MSPLLYLYGFVPDGAPAPSDELRGVEEQNVELVGLGSFSAAVSPVSQGEFGEDALNSRLRDLGWVGRQGICHERVVTWFLDHGGILPARLFTLFRSADALRRDAKSRSERILHLLDRFGHLGEWHLKVGMERGPIDPRLAEASPEVRAVDEAIGRATPGRAYLLERKRNELAEGEALAAARRLARELFDQAGEGAEASRVLPAAREATEPDVILNSAFLVHRDRGADFHARLRSGAERLQKLGLHVSFSGPWAPYRFIEDPPEAPARDGGP